MFLSNLLNDSTGILSFDSTPDIINQKFIIKELEKQKTKITIAQDNYYLDCLIILVKSLVKRKSKFVNFSFKENGKSTKKFLRHNLDHDKRDQLK